MKRKKDEFQKRIKTSHVLTERPNQPRNPALKAAKAYLGSQLNKEWDVRILSPFLTCLFFLF